MPRAQQPARPRRVRWRASGLSSLVGQAKRGPGSLRHRASSFGLSLTRAKTVTMPLLRLQPGKPESGVLSAGPNAPRQDGSPVGFWPRTLSNGQVGRVRASLSRWASRIRGSLLRKQTAARPPQHRDPPEPRVAPLPVWVDESGGERLPSDSFRSRPSSAGDPATCRNCGRRRKPFARFCVMCGAEFGPNEADQGAASHLVRRRDRATKPVADNLQRPPRSARARGRANQQVNGE